MKNTLYLSIRALTSTVQFQARCTFASGSSSADRNCMVQMYSSCCRVPTSSFEL